MLQLQNASQKLQNTSQIAALPVNVTTEQRNDQTDETLSTHPKCINKEKCRSEIRHCFVYKTDDKSERTDLAAPVCKRCYRPKSCCHRKTLNICKHLSLAHPDIFRELRDRQVSASFINSDLI